MMQIGGNFRTLLPLIKLLEKIEEKMIGFMFFCQNLKQGMNYGGSRNLMEGKLRGNQKNRWSGPIKEILDKFRYDVVILKTFINLRW